MRDLKGLSDEELALGFQAGEEDCSGELFERYYKRLCKMAAALYLVGGDREDLIQEGRMGLFVAMGSYDPDAGAGFSTFATLCIGRSMSHAIEKSNRKKNKPLNESLSLDYDEMQDSVEGAYLADESYGPEYLMIGSEVRRELEDRIQSSLSPFEKQVFADLVEGYDYKYIALKTGRSAKSIDNCIQRIRKKVKDIIKERA